jgi:hypothetical protein
MAGMDARTWETALTNRLREARKESMDSAEDVARAARQYGVLLHGDDIVKIESGERQLQFGEALVLSKLLDVSMPVVTARQNQWIVARYMQRQRELSKRFARLVFDLKICKKTVDELSDKLDELLQGYNNEIAMEDRDPNLDDALASLNKNAGIVVKLFDEADQRLDGMLSRPSEEARGPGTQ